MVPKEHHHQRRRLQACSPLVYDSDRRTIDGDWPLNDRQSCNCLAATTVHIVSGRATVAMLWRLMQHTSGRQAVNLGKLAAHGWLTQYNIWPSLSSLCLMLLLLLYGWWCEVWWNLYCTYNGWILFNAFCSAFNDVWELVSLFYSQCTRLAFVWCVANGVNRGTVIYHFQGFNFRETLFNWHSNVCCQRHTVQILLQ